jgi:hypothetical protein
MVLEMLRCSLHGVDYVSRGERRAMVARNADQQAAHERELRRQQNEFPSLAGLRAGPHSLFSERKLAAEDGVDEEVLQDVRMTVEEGSKAAVVGKGIMGGERFQRCAGPVADARGEGLHALHKTRPYVGLVQHHAC